MFVLAVPYWGVICIGVAALLIILACCGCLIRMCWKRRKDKQFKKGVKGAVDMKSVQMLTSAMKEKVCVLWRRKFWFSLCWLLACICRPDTLHPCDDLPCCGALEIVCVIVIITRFMSILTITSLSYTFADLFPNCLPFEPHAQCASSDRFRLFNKSHLISLHFLLISVRIAGG